MSTWSERFYYFTEKKQTMLETIATRPNIWNDFVDEVEEDKNITCVHSDVLGFMLDCTDEECESSKKRAFKIIKKYFEKTLETY